MRPFFVFLYSSLLSAPWWRFLDEPLQRSTLAVKLASILLIVVGIATVSLG
ncbi:MAG: hypothetical protein HYU43_06470 [Armatimonadetes bacterium]|nr:hypothetical protein [Armatimonadota bacterium]